MDDPTFVRTMENYGMPIQYQSSADFTEFWAAAQKEAEFQVNHFIKGK